LADASRQATAGLSIKEMFSDDRLDEVSRRIEALPDKPSEKLE
jgi:hypothetical protein